MRPMRLDEACHLSDLIPVKDDGYENGTKY